jgi:hypothetical protein
MRRMQVVRSDEPPEGPASAEERGSGEVASAALRLSRLNGDAPFPQRAAREARSVLESDIAAVALRRDQHSLVVSGVSGARTRKLLGLVVPRGAGVGGRVWVTRSLVSVADYSQDLLVGNGFAEVAREEGIGGAAGAPLIHLGEVTGVLYMAKRSPGRFGDRSLALLEEMAAILGPLCAVPERALRPARSPIEEEEATSAGLVHDVVGQILSEIGASARELRQRVTADGSSQALAEDLRSIEERAARAATHLVDLEARSPRISALSWGRIEIDGIGPKKDVKLWPGGGRAWDWTETATSHDPGIQPADVEELLDHGSRVVILSRGMELRLKTCPETFELLRQRDVAVHVEETRAGVKRYNNLAERGVPVGGLFHSTC